MVMHIGGFSGEFHGGTYIAFFNTTLFSLETVFFFENERDERTNKIKQFNFRTLRYGNVCCSNGCSKIIYQVTPGVL